MDEGKGVLGSRSALRRRHADGRLRLLRFGDAGGVDCEVDNMFYNRLPSFLVGDEREVVVDSDQESVPSSSSDQVLALLEDLYRTLSFHRFHL